MGKTCIRLRWLSLPLGLACCFTARPPVQPGPGDIRAVAASANSLGLALAPTLSAEAHNVVICPPTVTQAVLALLPSLRPASRGAVAKLVCPEAWSDDRALMGFRHLMEDIERRRGLESRSECGVWLDRDMEYCERYSRLAAGTLGASLGRLPAVERVAGGTELPWLIIRSELVFRAKWRQRFSKKDTALGLFDRWDGAVIKVPYMHGRLVVLYGQCETDQAVRMEFEECHLVADFVLPRAVEDLAALRARLRRLMEDGPGEGLGKRIVDVAIPALDVVVQHDVGSALRQVGMKDVIDDASHLDEGFVGGDHLSRGRVSVEQVVRLLADEEGLGVAARCDLYAGPGTRDQQVPTFVLGRPFALVIRDAVTGLVVVAAVIGDPLAGTARAGVEWSDEE